MQQDWVEFKDIKKDKVLLRPEYIQSILQQGNTTMLYYEYIPCGAYNDKATPVIELAEPYEQVKQKVMDAEKVDLSDVVVGHFTREEYKILEDVITQKLDQLAEDEPCTSNYYDHSHLLDKLDKILKEGNE